jgi:hypothetical protein
VRARLRRSRAHSHCCFCCAHVADAAAAARQPSCSSTAMTTPWCRRAALRCAALHARCRTDLTLATHHSLLTRGWRSRRCTWPCRTTAPASPPRAGRASGCALAQPALPHTLDAHSPVAHRPARADGWRRARRASARATWRGVHGAELAGVCSPGRRCGHRAACRNLARPRAAARARRRPHPRAAPPRRAGTNPWTRCVCATQAALLTLLLPQAVAVACRAAGAGASCDDCSEDVCVAFSDHVARLDVLDLAAVVRRYALHKKARVLLIRSFAYERAVENALVADVAPSHRRARRGRSSGSRASSCPSSNGTHLHICAPFSLALPSF